MIKFGTSGWRGFIADDFTFKNLKKAALGTGAFLKLQNASKGVIVGYDTRFMGREFAIQAVLALASKGIKSFLTTSDVPTPVISAYIIKNKLDGGINITASHNPYRYSGFKFSPSWGGPALPEDTKKLEELINSISDENILTFESLEEAASKNLYESIDPSKEYFNLLEKNVFLKDLSSSGIKVFFDAIHGTGRGYLDSVLNKKSIDVTTINENLDPYFSDKGPEPSSENLEQIKNMVKEQKELCVGVSTDGDADRFGIIGSDGEFIEPNKILALLADYLVNERDLPKNLGFARSFATSSLIDLVAKKYDRKLYENPVGFKYIGKLIADKKILIGGEESAGLSVINHVPEKDGILACLLLIEAMAKRKATTNELLDDFYKRVGRLETKRINIKVSQEIKSSLSIKLNEVKNNFLGKTVEKTEKMDGIKVYFKDSSWVLFRESGTEPLVRIYVEAKDNDDLTEMAHKAKEFLE